MAQAQELTLYIERREYYEKVLVLLISIFTLALNVSADSDHGICAGKEVTGEGYCTLESGVSISGVAFNPSVNNLTNGHPAAQYNYRGGINGKQNIYIVLTQT